MAGLQRREGIAREQAVGLDLHRGVEVEVEVVVGDVGVGAVGGVIRVGIDREVGAATSEMNARTDCESSVKRWVLTAPPPYVKVVSLMTTLAPVMIPTLPHMPGTRVGVVASPITLIAGTKGVVAVSSKIVVKSTSGSLVPSSTKPGESGL